jgi:hypothetical protein
MSKPTRSAKSTKAMRTAKTAKAGKSAVASKSAKSSEAPEPTEPPDTAPSIRRVMMPRDTNALGTIFGGVILAEVDLAAATEAHKCHPGGCRCPRTTPGSRWRCKGAMATWCARTAARPPTR